MIWLLFRFLILMEWKIPVLSGMALVQRIRKLGFNDCLIVILSSLVKKQDIPLLQEVGVDTVLEKPFEASQFCKELIGVVHQSRKPSEQRSFERKIRLLLTGNQLGEAERLINEYVSDPQIPAGAKSQIRAEYEYTLKHYDVAANLAVEALKTVGESVLLLTLLGKCFLQLKSFKNATSAFNRAQELSPNNVDRMLTLVNLNIEEGQLDKADNLLNEAKSIDDGRVDVVEMGCRLAIEKSDTKTATNLLKTLDSLTGIVGMINNDAVARIHAGKYEDGLKLYQQAIRSLPDGSAETRELITYNLALAYARYGDLEQSLKTMNSIETPSNEAKIFEKFQSFQSKFFVVTY